MYNLRPKASTFMRKSLRLKSLFSTASNNSILVVGGNGAMGQAVLETFKKSEWNTCSLDLVTVDEKIADKSYIIPTNNKISDYPNNVTNIVEDMKNNNEQFNIVVCAAGGWAGSDVDSDEFIESLNLLWQLNIQSAATATHLAAKFLKPNGMLTLTGAEAAAHMKKGTPGMVAYGMSKAATHHLVKSASETGLPNGCIANAVLPITIDTPTNRQFMPDADHSSWTSPTVISFLIKKLYEDNGNTIKNGALLGIYTENGESEFKEL
jgi:dihydropteridine reductase